MSTDHSALGPPRRPAADFDSHDLGRRKRRWLRLLAVAGLVAAGCSPPSVEPQKPGVSATSTEETGHVEPPAKVLTAQRVLKQMVDAYRQAKSYTDSGRVKVHFRRGDEPVDQEADFAVTLVRPNLIRLHVYQAIVLSNGERLRATIADLPGQVLDLPAPPSLSSADVYADPLLGEILTQGSAGGSPQLELLLGDDPAKTITEGAQEVRLLPVEPLDGRRCHRIEVVHEDDQLVLWIDEQDNLLRRIDYPVVAFKQAIQQQLRQQLEPAIAELPDEERQARIAAETTIGELSLTAVFDQARLDASIPNDAFRFEVPEGAQLVQAFDVRPESLKLMGAKINDFTFTDLDGNVVTRDSLAGKVVVVDFWATWCGPCIESLPNMKQVYEQYKDNPRVAFLAVNIDEPDVSDDKLREPFARAELEMTIVRDPEQHAFKTFRVEGLPNMFLLGPDGMVQDNEIGQNPQLATHLPAKLDELLAGKNLYDRAATEETSPVQENAAATGAAIPPRATVAERTEPKHVRLSSQWKTESLVRPGNMLVLDDNERILVVVDQWRNVAEIDAEGKVVAQHELRLPETSFVTFLRSTPDAQGHRLTVATAPGQKQFFVFDENWQQSLAFPEGTNPPITDVGFADLDGDGTPEIVVGYFDVVGVQGVSLEGERIWFDRSMRDVFAVAVTSADESRHRAVLCAHAGGTIVPIDHQGQRNEPITVGARVMRFVAAADLDLDGVDELCGIAIGAGGEETLVGFDLHGRELWNYPLPAGVHQTPVEMVTFGRMTEEPSSQWLIAGADGSIHIVAADGTPVDSFNYGAAITGIAAAEFSGARLLLVSTDDGVEAWQLGL